MRRGRWRRRPSKRLPRRRCLRRLLHRQPRRPAVPRPGRPRLARQRQPAPTAAPLPQLGPVLSPEEQREYNGAIDQSLGRAQASLRAIGNRRLSREQQASVARDSGFYPAGAGKARVDLPGARRLAERAEVLADSLEKSLH